jgi:RNA polymerase sigma-70 factor (ECF subfamily)
MRSPSSRLTVSIDAARSVYPNLSVTEREFASFLAHRIDADELDHDAVTRHTADLLLVCAVLRAEPTGISTFERTILAPLDKRLARIVGDAAVHEVKQRLRETLLMAKPGSTAGIAQYRGRGPLRAWVRVAAVRVALKVRAEQTRNKGEDPDLDILGPDVDPVLQMVRERYASEFRTAFELALQTLEPGDRRLLRQQFVDGLGTEALAELYRVHRVTMFRRLVRIRTELLAATRSELASRSRLKNSELDSVIHALKDRVDLTLERVLASQPAATVKRARKARRNR